MQYSLHRCHFIKLFIENSTAAAIDYARLRMRPFFKSNRPFTFQVVFDFKSLMLKLTQGQTGHLSELVDMEHILDEFQKNFCKVNNIPTQDALSVA